MRSDHIINLIEERPLNNLSASEIERVNAHTSDCAECLLAFEAARASSLLLRERASVTVEPSPFFQTRVLAAIRERGGERNPAPEMFGLRKMWQAARILVTSMAVVVAMLTALTFLTDRAQLQPDQSDLASGSGADSAEWVIFESNHPANDDLTYSQVLTNLYDQEAKGEDGRQQ